MMMALKITSTLTITNHNTNNKIVITITITITPSQYSWVTDNNVFTLVITALKIAITLTVT